MKKAEAVKSREALIAEYPYQLVIRYKIGEKETPPQIVGVRKLNDLRRLSGPGWTNKVVCDLKKYRRAQSELPDRTVIFEITEKGQDNEKKTNGQREAADDRESRGDHETAGSVGIEGGTTGRD